MSSYGDRRVVEFFTEILVGFCKFSATAVEEYGMFKNLRC